MNTLIYANIDQGIHLVKTMQHELKNEKKNLPGFT